MNRKDVAGKHMFSGGFLGLDNIGVFDRSKPLPGGGLLEQADGTAWMAFYCVTMLSMALELAQDDPAYEDIASKFFEHFVAIADAMNTLGGNGLWDEEDGFYYDQLHVGGTDVPLRVRSMVGLIPLFAVEVLDQETDRPRARIPQAHGMVSEEPPRSGAADFVYGNGRTKPGVTTGCWRFRRATGSSASCVMLLDPNEFLSPYGIRSLSQIHRDHPFILQRGRRGAAGGLRTGGIDRRRCSAAIRTGAGRSGFR